MDFLHGVSSQFADARVRKCVWMSGSIASYLFAGITLACFELLGALFVPKAQFTKQALRLWGNYCLSCGWQVRVVPSSVRAFPNDQPLFACSEIFLGISLRRRAQMLV